MTQTCSGRPHLSHSAAQQPQLPLLLFVLLSVSYRPLYCAVPAAAAAVGETCAFIWSHGHWRPCWHSHTALCTSTAVAATVAAAQRGFLADIAASQTLEHARQKGVLCQALGRRRMSESLQALVGGCPPQGFELAQGNEKTCTAVKGFSRALPPLRSDFQSKLAE